MLALPEVSLLGVKIRFIAKLSSFGVKNQHEQSFEITGKRETENLSRLIYYLETVKYFEVVRKSSGTNQVCPTMEVERRGMNVWSTEENGDVFLPTDPVT